MRPKAYRTSTVSAGKVSEYADRHSFKELSKTEKLRQAKRDKIEMLEHLIEMWSEFEEKERRQGIYMGPAHREVIRMRDKLRVTRCQLEAHG